MLPLFLTRFGRCGLLPARGCPSPGLENTTNCGDRQHRWQGRISITALSLSRLLGPLFPLTLGSFRARNARDMQ